MHEQHLPRKVTEAIERECNAVDLALVAHLVEFDRKYWLAFEKALAVVQIPVRRYIVIQLRERWVLDGNGHRSLSEAEIMARVKRETGSTVSSREIDSAKALIVEWTNRYAA